MMCGARTSVAGATIVAVLGLLSGCGADAPDADVHLGTAALPEGGTAPETVVELADFTIEPAAISLTAGGRLEVTNVGANDHDLVVETTEIHSGTIAPGDDLIVDAASLAPGTYTVFCSITGHREAGMEATLVVI